MFSKINVTNIVRDHFCTLKKYDSDRWSSGDFLLFVGVPVVVTVWMLVAELLLTKAAVGVLFAGISIFAGLLLNLLMMAHGIIRSTVGKPRYKDEKRLLREIYSNISYSILAAIVMLGVMLIRFVTAEIVALYIISGLTYLLIGNFLLTLLMVLKRIHVVLENEFSAVVDESPGTIRR